MTPAEAAALLAGMASYREAVTVAPGLSNSQLSNAVARLDGSGGAAAVVLRHALRERREVTDRRLLLIAESA